MGTKGLWGIYYNGRFYLIYNGMDSYPSELGADIEEMIKNAIKNGDIARWKKLANNLKYVNGESIASAGDIALIDPGKKGKKIAYADLLYNKYTSFKDLLDIGLVPVNNITEATKPSFEEYNYVLNLDNDTLDYYKYSKLQDSYPLDDLPNFKDWESNELQPSIPVPSRSSRSLTSPKSTKSSKEQMFREEVELFIQRLRDKNLIED